MNKLEFEVYEGATMESIGTIAEQVGKKGSAKFSKKNFLDESKRVVVVATNEQDESVVVTCSAPVSKQLRKAKAEGASKEELLAQAVQLPIYDTAKGFFIGFKSEGAAAKGSTIADLFKTKVATKLVNAGALDEVPW